MVKKDITLAQLPRDHPSRCLPQSRMPRETLKCRSCYVRFLKLMTSEQGRLPEGLLVSGGAFCVECWDVRPCFGNWDLLHKCRLGEELPESSNSTPIRCNSIA